MATDLGVETVGKSAFENFPLIAPQIITLVVEAAPVATPKSQQAFVPLSDFLKGHSVDPFLGTTSSSGQKSTQIFPAFLALCQNDQVGLLVLSQTELGTAQKFDPALEFQRALMGSHQTVHTVLIGQSQGW